VQIVLVALNALPVIDATVPGPIGGLETRAWLLARGLARRGESVQMVVRHTRSLPRKRFADVELVGLTDRLYPLRESVGQRVERVPGFPGIRIRRFSPRLLWQLPRLVLDRLLHGRAYQPESADVRLSALNADVYCTFGVQAYSATVIRSAHSIGRPAALFLGSDGDLNPLFTTEGPGQDPYGTPAAVGREILLSADRIIVQTPEQQRLLSERFGRSSTLLRNPIDVESWTQQAVRPLDPGWTAGLDRFVLWVGRAEETHKRPQLCLELARACPDVMFLMILNPRDPEVEARIRGDAPGNLRIVERVPAEGMPAVFSRAAALVSTSRLEGFPNVFLQAALTGVPIASLEVGSEFLAASGAGECTAGDLPALADLVRRVWNRQRHAGLDPEHARRWVLEHHELGRQVDLLRQDLRTLFVLPEERPA
jgi:glycosyltransferase involved in cell wall biosynthesis